MTPIDYAVMRLTRRLLPEQVVSWFKARRLFLVPGLETRLPGQAVDRYLGVLANAGADIEGRKVLVLGYGGSFGVGIELLRRGARHVSLLDPYARPSRVENERFLTTAPEYVSESKGRIVVDGERLSILDEDACSLADRIRGEFDVVLSSSVLEHVVQLESLVGCLRRLTSQDGVGGHIVDLRDHYFKYPFEMLCYSDRTWTQLLEPSTRLSRNRLWDYEATFSKYFRQVSIDVLESDPEELARVKDRIRPKFLSGDERRDCATKIAVYCAA